MLNRILRIWIWSGLDPHVTENINSVRITNVISLIIITILLMQIPFSFWFWSEGGHLKLPVLAIHICLFTLIPVSNKLNHPRLAKIALVLIYINYIFISCLLWQVDVGIQYFLILGVFVCPFIFEADEASWMWAAILLLDTIFVSLCIFYLLRETPAQISSHYPIIRFFGAIFFTLASTLISCHIGRNVSRSRYKLLMEKQRSEDLLLNILPAPIAKRLKNKETLIADHFEQASILFADIEGFTKVSKGQKPDDLVILLDDIFSHLDNITSKYGLEKIKTMGDGYMAAAGVPLANSYHALQCCQCALDIQAEFLVLCKQHNLSNGLRIGIGSGEVIAGVIGKNKFCYDLWGEAVTLASRMESHGKANQIQVTQFTFEMAKHKYCFKERGKISIKGLGLISTYWLLGRK
ncbi:MAG: adenylate cyclase [Paraglaciecola sp.]|jgi:adenylate cyclase